MDINKYQEFKYSRSYAKLPKISFLQPIDMRKARNRWDYGLFLYLLQIYLKKINYYHPNKTILQSIFRARSRNVSTPTSPNITYSRIHRSVVTSAAKCRPPANPTRRSGRFSPLSRFLTSFGKQFLNSALFHAILMVTNQSVNKKRRSKWR